MNLMNHLQFSLPKNKTRDDSSNSSVSRKTVLSHTSASSPRESFISFSRVEDLRSSVASNNRLFITISPCCLRNGNYSPWSNRHQEVIVLSFRQGLHERCSIDCFR